MFFVFFHLLEMMQTEVDVAAFCPCDRVVVTAVQAFRSSLRDNTAAKNVGNQSNHFQPDKTLLDVSITTDTFYVCVSVRTKSARRSVEHLILPVRILWSRSCSRQKKKNNNHRAYVCV